MARAVTHDDIEAFAAHLTDAELAAAATLALVADRVGAGVTQHRELMAEEIPLFIKGGLLGWSKYFDLLRQQRAQGMDATRVYDRNGREPG
jgi:hypothetical protein